jgi:starch synthase
MAKAKEIGIKIVIDSLTRISSARPHKKYKKYFVYRLDEHNKQVTLYGTDGRSYHFEDTILLNYRKKRVWEVLLDEIVAFKDKYGVNGIHLDNGHAWP